MWECVTIDDKTLFVHLLVISVFVNSYILKFQDTTDVFSQQNDLT
jgi:hypothetical protein